MYANTSVEVCGEAMREAFNINASANTGCIIYVCDRSHDGIVFDSECDRNDALTMIDRIMDRFGIDNTKIGN